MPHSIVRRGFPGRLPVLALLALLGLWGAPRAWATDITSCPFTINSPGVYHVTQDLNCPNEGTAIEVNTDNVTLSLDGHTITGPGSVEFSAFAIDVVGENVSVSNGSIQNFGAAVILETGPASISGLTITHCHTGIELDSDGNTVSNNTITGGDTGIADDGRHNTVTGNTASNNSTGIQLNLPNGNAATVTGNTALNNQIVDLFDEASACDENVWSGNCFGTANKPCIGTSVCGGQVSITCPQSRTVTATFASSTLALVDVGAPTTTPSGLPVVGVRADGLALAEPFPLGTTTINWTVNPGLASAQSCMQSITVNPPGAPTITCPGNKTVTAALGRNSATVAVGMATTNAQGAAIVGIRSDGKALTDPFPVGATTITWMVTADDLAPVTCIQTITVQSAPAFPFIVHGPSEANPHIDSIFVDRGPVYQEAIIHGSGFADVEGTSYVTLGGHQIPVLAWTNVAIGVLINPLAFKQSALALNAAYPVQVVIPANGRKSNTVDFFLTDGPPPDYTIWPGP
jgi:parallel beta-helix repeat protein